MLDLPWLFICISHSQWTVNTLYQTLSEAEKLKYIDFELSFTNEGKFNIFSLLTGYMLLNIAAFGLDQDLAQRVLSCKNKKEAGWSLYGATLLSIPVSMLFLSIGLLLFLYYQEHTISQKFAGESVTIFMYYILNEMPNGLKGFVTIGAIAAALSSTNSVLGAMSSVAIEDVYRPYKNQSDGKVDEQHFVKVARAMVLVFAIALSLMAIVSFIVHINSDIPLISFALGVMAYAYSGLLGVFGSALFTNRGNAKNDPLCTCYWICCGSFYARLYIWIEYRICVAVSNRYYTFIWGDATWEKIVYILE